MYQNLGDTEKAIVRGTFVEINTVLVPLKCQNKIGNNWLIYHKILSFAVLEIRILNQSTSQFGGWWGLDSWFINSFLSFCFLLSSVPSHGGRIWGSSLGSLSKGLYYGSGVIWLPFKCPVKLKTGSPEWHCWKVMCLCGEGVFVKLLGH